MCWATRLNGLTDDAFQRRYKFTKFVFHRLADKLRIFHASRFSNANHATPMEVQLSMTLRFLAGGYVYDIADMHGVGESTFYTIVKRTMGNIVEILPLSFPFGDESKLQELEQGFARRTDGVLRGIVGAIDGLAVRIRKPRRNVSGGTQGDCDDPMSYFSRKGFFALNVQACVDYERQFMWASTDFPGS